MIEQLHHACGATLPQGSSTALTARTSGEKRVGTGGAARSTGRPQRGPASAELGWVDGVIRRVSTCERWWLGDWIRGVPVTQARLQPTGACTPGGGCLDAWIGRVP